MGPEDQAAFEDRFKEAVKRWGPEDQVSLEDRFREAVTRWEAHCEANSIHSDPAKYVEFSSVNEIFAMGREALPLIKAYLIKHPDSKILPPLWVILVRAIGVELKIPKKIRGYTERIRAHLIAVLSASQPFAKD